MSLFIVGVDGGGHPAATILDATRIVAAFHGDLSDVNRQLCEWCSLNKEVPGRIAVEAVFSPLPKKDDDNNKHKGGSVHSAIKLAENVGETLYAIKGSGYPAHQIVRVYQQTWRAALGFKSPGRDAKEAQAREMAGRAMGRVLRIGETDLAESFCIATWCKTEYILSQKRQVTIINPR